MTKQKQFFQICAYAAEGIVKKCFSFFINSAETTFVLGDDVTNLETHEDLSGWKKCFLQQENKTVMFVVKHVEQTNYLSA